MVSPGEKEAVRPAQVEEPSPIKRRNPLLMSLQAGRLETSTPKRGAGGSKAAKRKSWLNESEKISFGPSGTNDKTCTDTEKEYNSEESGEKKKLKNWGELSYNSDSDESFLGFK